MNAHDCPGLQNFYTCSAGDFKGCCSVNPCNTGVCPDGKAANQDENTSSLSDSSSTSIVTATAGNMNGPLIGTTMTTEAAHTNTGIGGSATTTDAVTGTKTGTGATTQPQAGTVWSIPGGISGPSPRPALLGTPSRPDTVTTTGNNSTSTGTSTSTNPSTSACPSSPTTSTTSLSPTEQTESATSSASPNPSSSSSGSGNNKALIGGVVGGILALGIILAVIFVLFCRRKKRRRRRRRFTLLAWHGPQYVDREKEVVVAAAGVGSGESLSGSTSYNYNHAQVLVQSQTTPTPISSTMPATSPNFNTHTPTSTTCLRTPTLPSPAPSFTSPSPERRHPHPLSPIPSISSNPSLHSTLSSKHDMVMSIEQDLGVHPALREVSTEKITGTGTGTGTEREIGTETGAGTRIDPETTPELGDTGFYRQRAELATYSQSELINIPHERRHLVPIPPLTSSPSPSPSPNPSSSHSSNNNPYKPRGTKIITPDGVLLSANFERFPGCEDYATSFAQCFDGLGIQLVEEEVLPGIRVDGGGVDEKRESDDLGS
ncbi:uncharacterized protein ASPGLDRAFT_35650 [Aspergillus glaucus CBS 516.65]|uniref:Uncharacterized protein n=1 Tax=Aspergillus glaucus CBS 516.65 TaxID=1160497 RepID=A0A1L9VKD7_ASPGL|nr:hypothetical protein ASPGLDRAFT_35650 [Aspergillus glaucus CBS 516.65]OJJ84386.1 hypothetical protein ASPGLDRAFT_35650 [Aspergillus glaucus CBS 516.65]